MKKTCIIHIGMPKTGTSSLQATLFSVRKELLNNDINYFSYSENHNALAAAFGRIKAKGQQSLININENESDIKRALLIEAENNTCSKFIISAEALGMILPAGVLDMHNLLKPHFDAFKILCYVREPFGYARSAAQQHIKAGSVSEKLINNTLNRDQPGWGNVLPNYKRRLVNYVEVFGKENVEVRDFSQKKLKNEDIVDDFLISYLDYPGETSHFSRIRANTSLSASLGRLYEALNREVPVMLDGKVNPSRSVDLIARLKLFSERQDSSDPFVLYDMNLEMFAREISSDVEWLKTEFEINFDMDLPTWDKRKIDLHELALLMNFLSCLVDDMKDGMMDERKKRSECQSALREEREIRQFLQQRILAKKGNAAIKEFEAITKKVSNVPFLESHSRALKNEGNAQFYEIVQQRIKHLIAQ